MPSTLYNEPPENKKCIGKEQNAVTEESVEDLLGQPFRGILPQCTKVALQE
jgi:hypothetical protein